MRKATFTFGHAGSIALNTQNIYRKRGGERSQSRIGTGKSGCNDADNEQKGDYRPQVLRSKQRQNIVGRSRQGNIIFGSQHQQHGAQCEEQQIERHKRKAVPIHVFLGVAQTFAGEVFLHHVLVEPGHDDGDEYAAEKLLEEVLFRVPVVEYKHAGMSAVNQSGAELAQVHIQLFRHLKNQQNESRNQTNRLQSIGPHNGFDATSVRVQPNEKNRHSGRHHKRHMPRVEDDILQNKYDQIKTYARPHGAREQKERSTGFIGIRSEALLQISVNTGEVEPVIERKQHVGNNQVAEKEPENHLHIGKLRATHPARHRHKAHTRDGRTEHADGHHPPGRFAVSEKECIIVGALAPYNVRNKPERREVNDYD